MIDRQTQRLLRAHIAGRSHQRADLRAREVLAVAPLLALMVFLGFYPKPLTDVITPAVDATMQDAGFTDPAPTQGDGEPAAAPTR